MARTQKRWIAAMFARLMSGIAVGALVALGIAAAPAIGAADVPSRPAKPVVARGFAAFTPASADPRLAAIFARGGLDTSGFRFTPSDGRRPDRRAVTLSVVARSNRAAPVATRIVAAESSTTTLRPIAYNLGVAVGWRRLMLSGEVAKVDLAGMPGSRQAADVGVSYGGKRFSGQVKATADRPIGGSPKLIEEAPAYSIDVGGSYALTRRLDVTAGVRYKAERDRLTSVPSTADQRDSQAVYVGTAFRF